MTGSESTHLAYSRGTNGFVAVAQRTAGALGVVLLAAWFVWTWGLTIGRMVRYYTPVPYLDYWRTAMLLRLYQTANFRVLWLQHNEHRIVCPELVFAVD